MCGVRMGSIIPARVLELSLRGKMFYASCRSSCRSWPLCILCNSIRTCTYLYHRGAYSKVVVASGSPLGPPPFRTFSDPRKLSLTFRITPEKFLSSDQCVSRLVVANGDSASQATAKLSQFATPKNSSRLAVDNCSYVKSASLNVCMYVPWFGHHFNFNSQKSLGYCELETRFLQLVRKWLDSIRNLLLVGDNCWVTLS